ncbi:hypothetical protein EZV62_027561 [Acer yangbiense]|uniref:HAT C-terminal dimerisation domain-containing protein n=1 Tax=Acer yangbiense TaxID=1000413 RepID=A0A5C7GUZ0_9ROSI|nr:hypothetical protein EZV62_027561 [Acer yangbiense]
MRFAQRSIEVYQNQSLLSGKRAIGTNGSSCLTLAAQHFDHEVSRIELSRMILMHDYPLKMVEHEGFRDYIRSLQPLFKPISRTTARRDIMSMYELERASLLSILGKILGRIAITSDMWTASNQKRGRLSPSSLIMNGRLFHMRYAAHILNLIVKSGLDVIEFGIQRIRDSVAFWTATPKRLEKFEEAANFLNIGCEKRLMLDCKTRWNSTYLMLSLALNYKEVFYHLNQRESQYKIRIEKSDWVLAKEMLKVGEKRSKEIKAICNSEFNHDDEMDSLDGFFSWNSESSVINEKSELDCYLEEKTLPQSCEFDVLGWWKLNGIKYPKMSEIARDILAIPVSTIASKSSFSTSGRIVSAQRNRLLPSTLEAIMCTQNWLWAGKKGNTIDGVGDIDVDDDNDNEVNEATCAGAANASK